MTCGASHVEATATAAWLPFSAGHAVFAGFHWPGTRAGTWKEAQELKQRFSTGM